MQNVDKIKYRSFQAIIPVKDYLGRNSFGAHSALKVGESRELSNWDIYTGNGTPYIASRGGSAFLAPEDTPEKRGGTAIRNAITWDVGSEEYLITQEGSRFFAQALLSIGNPVEIKDFDGNDFILGGSSQADMFLSGDKIYVFHETGNRFIDWNGTNFYGYQMGMPFASIDAAFFDIPGQITGSYTLGVELCYFRDGLERMSSTPNRIEFGTNNSIINLTFFTNGFIEVILDSTVLTDPNVLWTHIRMWRSKNKTNDTTDPLNPIEAQGTESELYEEALITKAEILQDPVAPIATGTGPDGEILPDGNANTQAGQNFGAYTIRLNSPDSVLFNLIGIERIELPPLPPASVGCHLGKKIYVSAVNDPLLDDQSRNNIYYSLYAGTPYSAQFNPLNWIDTNRDGLQMRRLVAFENDLIGIKESKTGRLMGGNVDLEYETLDHRIGAEGLNFAQYVPGIGIVAITNDHSDFRVFGYDLKWNHELNGQEISLPIRAETQVITNSTTAIGQVSFGYINGKFMLCNGTGMVLVLHEKEGRGWTKYLYPQILTERMFIFGNGKRAAFVSRGTYLVEFELASVTVDVNTTDDTPNNVILLAEETWKFQSDDGRDNLEPNYLAVMAKLTVPVVAVPFSNGLPWPDGVNESITQFVPDPANFGVEGSPLAEAEYRLYLEPKTVGNLQWSRLRGNFIHYKIRTIAPAIMRTRILNVNIDQDGMGFGEFDPFQVMLAAKKGPLWRDNADLLFNFDQDITTLFDQSGLSLHHTWAAIGTQTFITDMPPRHGMALTGAPGSGYYRAGYTAMEHIGDAAGLNSIDLSFRWVLQYTTPGVLCNVQGGGDGTYFWEFRIEVDGGFSFYIHTSAISYRHKTAAASVIPGVDMTVTFFLKAGGAVATCYGAPRTDGVTKFIRVTRTIMVAPSGPSASAVARDSTIQLSHAGIYRATGNNAVAQAMHDEFKDSV